MTRTVEYTVGEQVWLCDYFTTAGQWAKVASVSDTEVKLKVSRRTFKVDLTRDRLMAWGSNMHYGVFQSPEQEQAGRVAFQGAQELEREAREVLRRTTINDILTNPALKAALESLVAAKG